VQNKRRIIIVSLQLFFNIMISYEYLNHPLLNNYKYNIESQIREEEFQMLL